MHILDIERMTTVGGSACHFPLGLATTAYPASNEATA